MADFVFNVAKGRVVELWDRVKANDPINSGLVLVALNLTGLESDALMKDRDTLSAVLANSTECSIASYARKTLTDTDLAAFTFSADDTNDRFDIDFADQTWSTVAAGAAWAKLLVCYNPDTTSGTDASIIPLTAHDFVVTPDGSDIVAQVASGGFVRAT